MVHSYVFTHLTFFYHLLSICCSLLYRGGKLIHSFTSLLISDNDFYNSAKDSGPLCFHFLKVSFYSLLEIVYSSKITNVLAPLVYDEIENVIGSNCFTLVVLMHPFCLFTRRTFEICNKT